MSHREKKFTSMEKLNLGSFLSSQILQVISVLVRVNLLRVEFVSSDTQRLSQPLVYDKVTLAPMNKSERRLFMCIRYSLKSLPHFL